jgi:uncharacterized cupin superfamily protein
VSANVFSEDWQRSVEHGPFGTRGSSVGRAAGARRLGATVYELDPGRRNLPYHAHFGLEEMLIVLRGRPTLRTPAGERELAEGDVVAFHPGRDGAHQLINNTEQPVRFLIVSSPAEADVVEYPDSGKVAARGGQWGTPEAVALTFRSGDSVDYFDGE